MNFYEVLGISENASQIDIKKAYRSLSLKLHPDKQGGNADEFKKISEAYTILYDPEKRQEYDFSLRSSKQPPPSFNFPNPPSNVGDVFNMMFNNEGFSQFIKVNLEKVAKNMTIKKPVPIVTTIELTFQQAYDGYNYPLHVDRFLVANPDSPEDKTYETETVYVTVPSGIDENEIIVVSNKGNVIGENSGDIKCCIKIKNDTAYTREGMDLRYKKELSLKESLCGFSFPIHHLDGKTYNINNTMGRIIAPGMKQIIPKLGMKRGDPANYGNLIIDFEIKFPESLTLEQRETLLKTL
jgi:DnaJ-class molecular chaperone